MKTPVNHAVTVRVARCKCTADEPLFAVALAVTPFHCPSCHETTRNCLILMCRYCHHGLCAECISLFLCDKAAA